MPAPTSVAEFIGLVQKSGATDPRQLEAFLAQAREKPLPGSPADVAELLTGNGILTRFQATYLLKGKWRNLVLSGKYTILEQIGVGGMGSVFLCAHKIMKRLVAIKVLSSRQLADPSGVERFHREARAVAQLRHPNIAVAHDVDQDGAFHFLVMEYIEGSSLYQLVKTSGQMSPTRAAHYIHQAALGLQHAHEAGLVHRDVKPDNILVDREGTVKILDLGLARFFQEQTDSITKRYEAGTVLGTADYLAPEQVVDSHNVSPRADIYSLGLTFYFLLVGRNAVQDGSVVQKLLWHQMRESKPISDIRADVPSNVAAIISKMTAKDPNDRYQTMAEVAEALAPLTATPIPPPSADEMPQSDIARRFSVGDGSWAPSASVKSRPPAPAKTVTPCPAPKRSAGSTITAGDTAKGIPPQPVRHEVIAEAEEVVEDWESQKTTVQKAPPLRKGRNKRKKWLIAAGMGIVLLIGAVVAALWPSPKPESSNAAKPAGTSVTQADSPKKTPAITQSNGGKSQPEVSPRADTKLSITSTIDGIRVQTPKYEAVIDKADGCLSSFRVAGMEFLRNGAPLAGGKTLARGAYFYYEKDGHQGLVKLPDVKQEGANVVVATGEKFSVRYEFGANSLTLTAQNSTDDLAPFYMIFDSAAVLDVVNDKGERQSVPVPLTQRDPRDPKWQRTTWIAGRARVKVTDLTGNGMTRIWGPFSEFRSQVWEADATTYNHCKIELEASIGPEQPKPVLTPGGVLITRDGAARRVQTELYDAVVDADGCMPSLRVDGVEVMKANIDVSRGAYFLQAGTLKLFDVNQPSASTVTAKSDQAAIQYDFAPNKMTWTVENKTAGGMHFFVVFDTTVSAVRNQKDEWFKTPTVSPANDARWASTTWYAGRAKLTLTGGSKVWGPWSDRYQVWEATLAPKEKRVIGVELGFTDAAEAKKLGEVTGHKPALATALTLDSPTDYQVFQRHTKQEGAIAIHGRVRSAYDSLEIRTVGLSIDGALPDHWREVPLMEKTLSFEASVAAPAGGWYKVEVRALKAGKVVGQVLVDHVGIGEVFIGAGQSNSTNCGQERIQQVSGMVSSFSGTSWQLANDPQPGVHDTSVGGSYWPAFGDEMYAKYHVPIGVASTGHSGTSVNQWNPGGELFRWTTGRMKQFGPEGFRAVLWHQGESDVGMPAEEYARKMTALIQESRKAAGWDVPWFVAQVSYHNPTQTSFAPPRAGQKSLWDSGIALEGPDTDTLGGDNRDEGGKGIHFSPKGLKAHGKMWAAKAAVYLDKKLNGAR